jgi:hypothetical protein
MNDRYGVDPQTPSSRRDLADLLRLFDPSEGRFVVEYPDDWRDRLLQHVSAWSELDRKRAEEAVTRMRRVLLPNIRIRRYDDQKRWAENASVLTAQEGVRSLIGPAGSPANVVALPDLMEEAQPLPNAREAFIPRDVEHYLQVAEPIFRTSHKIIVIDRFFHLHNKSGDLHPRYRVLEQFVTEAERCGVRAFHLVADPDKVFSETDPKGLRYQAELNHIQSKLKSIALTFSPRPDCCHARYLLGNHSGLQFDHGFDVDDHFRKEPRQRNHVHWLTDGILRRLHQEYGWVR